MEDGIRKSRVVWSLIALGWLVGVAVTAVPVQAKTANGPYYAPPAWARKMPVNARFVVLKNWDSEAVLDRETGLVWERSPSAVVGAWSDARFSCINKDISNRKGWRVPSVVELASLMDPSIASGVKLPLGHPFSNVQSDSYWSASTLAEDPTTAWIVDFNVGDAIGTIKSNSTVYTWCVRGGMNADAY